MAKPAREAAETGHRLPPSFVGEQPSEHVYSRPADRFLAKLIDDRPLTVGGASSPSLSGAVARHGRGSVERPEIRGPFGETRDRLRRLS